MTGYRSKRERPNILILMADQWAGPVTSWSGHPLIRTPNLDRLANKGVVFQNAYCPSPLCAPSRFSFMSGQLPTRIGAYDNAAEFTSSIPTFAHYLRRMGYRTCLTGKMHFVGADQLHGFEERTTTDVYPADLAWTPDWTRFEDRIAWWYHNLLPVKQAGVAEITNQLEYDDEVAHQARQWLYDAARKPERQPFLMVTSFTHPHDPYACRQRYWDLYDHESIDLPRVGPIAKDTLDAHSRRLHHVSAMDHFEVTLEDVRNARHAYYGAISYLDEQIGTLLDILEVTGLAERTVVLLCADHGDMLGERGLWYKMSFFEMSARIPMLVHWPAMFSPRSIDTAVSLLDVLPTGRRRTSLSAVAIRRGRRRTGIYTDDFLIERPMLEALRRPEDAVLLIDEIDRADHEFEAFLLEFLSDFQISIPERGTIRAFERPVVILTSNRTRELHEALRRRCIYHWIDYPDPAAEAEIVMMRASGVARGTARAVVQAVTSLRREPLAKPPGIAETVDWAEASTLLHERGAAWPDAFRRAIGAALKDEEDIAYLGSRLDGIVRDAAA